MRTGLAVVIMIAVAAAMAPAADEACQIVLFGDSTVIADYLPEADRQHTMLEQRLKATYPGQSVRVANVAEGGDFIGSFICSGRYETSTLRRFEKIDIAIVRYGQNDLKNMGQDRFEKWFDRLVDTLQADYPGIVVIAETGLYCDPAHATSNWDRHNNTYWERTRVMARRRNLPLCDFYQAGVAETQKGNWDLRIRNDGKTFDASKDAEHPNDLRWFSNAHPNRNGNVVATDARATLLKQLCPTMLPTRGGRRVGDGRSSVFKNAGIEPQIEVLLDEKGPTDTAPFMASLKHTACARANYRVTCRVKATEGAAIKGQIRLATSQRKESAAFRMGEAVDGWQPARAYMSATPTGKGEETLEVELGAKVTIADLRVERLVWDPEIEAKARERAKEVKKE